MLATLVEGVARGIFEQPLHLACGSYVFSLLPTLLIVAMFSPGWVRVLHWSRAELRLQLTRCSRLLFILATCLERLKDPDSAILLRTCLRLSPRRVEGSKQRQFVTVMFAAAAAAVAAGMCAKLTKVDDPNRSLLRVFCCVTLLIAGIWDQNNATLVPASTWHLKTWPAFLKRVRLGWKVVDPLRSASYTLFSHVAHGAGAVLPLRLAREFGLLWWGGMRAGPRCAEQISLCTWSGAPS